MPQMDSIKRTNRHNTAVMLGSKVDPASNQLLGLFGHGGSTAPWAFIIVGAKRRREYTPGGAQRLPWDEISGGGRRA
ncbi:hypothetical protein NBRC116494_08010 [Aurantivibrio plasticivorans]